MNAKSRARKGQSLLETLVALGVLVTGFLGLLTLLSQSLRYNRITGDDLRATYLAEEGIELAKNSINYDMFNGNGWLHCLAPDHAYEMDFTSQFNQQDNCNSSGANVKQLTYAVSYSSLSTPSDMNDVINGVAQYLRPLYFSNNEGFGSAGVYGYENDLLSSDPTETNIKRVIFITQPDTSNPNEVEIDSVVLWPGSAGESQMVLTDYMYRWFPS